MQNEDTSLTRRDFLAISGALALSGGVFPCMNAVPLLKTGVISDTHITDLESTLTLRRALEYFRDRQVDAVVIAGDLTNNGLVSELGLLAETWYSVFPGDRAPDGRRVERFFIAGNHDVGVYGRSPNPNANMGESECDIGKSGGLPLVNVGFAKAWRHFFGEEFALFFRKRIKGYDFLGAHWDPAVPIELNSPTPLWHIREAKKALATIDRNRPFFYIQHPHLKGTVLHPESVFTHDDGAMTELLNGFPAAVALSGHSHVSLTDERTLWRGNFTAIGASTLKRVNASGIHDNHASLVRDTGCHHDVRQGLVIELYDRHIVCERRDFSRGEAVDTPWTVSIPATANGTGNTVRHVEPPRFAHSAKVRVVPPAKPEAAGKIFFPQALANRSTRPYDYEIKVDHDYAGVRLTLGMFRILSPSVLLPKRYDSLFPDVEWRLEPRHLPKYDLGRIKVTITALDSRGVRGGSIESAWIKVPKT